MSSSIRNLGVFVVYLWAITFTSILMAEDLSPERITYRGNPLPISLSVGHERRITFEHPVWVDVPESLSRLTTQIVGPDLYWKAEQAFNPVRIMVGEEGGSNQIYLVNLQAVQQDKAAPQLLVSLDKPQTSASTDERGISHPVQKPKKRIGYGGLFRYAVKQLYAPERLRQKGSSPMLSHAPIPRGRIHHLVRFHKVETHAMDAWQSDTHYVTALSVTNATDMPITLDPREIRGEILAARFQRNHLDPHGEPGDTTSLFVISDRPLSESMAGHAVRVDPAKVNLDKTTNQASD